MKDFFYDLTQYVQAIAKNRLLVGQTQWEPNFRDRREQENLCSKLRMTSDSLRKSMVGQTQWVPILCDRRKLTKLWTKLRMTSD